MKKCPKGYISPTYVGLIYLIDEIGGVVVKYVYDAWGNHAGVG